jgi:hypothetical protein
MLRNIITWIMLAIALAISMKSSLETLSGKDMESGSLYSLETNNEYAVIWNRTDVSMTLTTKILKWLAPQV